MNNIEFLNWLRSDDVLAHYTKRSTAEKFIIPNNNILLSSKQNTSDLFDRITASEYAVNLELNDSNTVKNEYKLDQCRLFRDKIALYNKNTKIACFCKNIISNDNKFPFDNYAFFHPRMWDQYGENYKGVCFLFSKSELSETNEAYYKNLFVKDVCYKNIRTLNHRGLHLYVRPESMFESSIEAAELAHLKAMVDMYSRKSIDYSDENEVRFILFPEEKDFSENQYLDIGQSLKGIVRIFPNNSLLYKKKPMQKAFELEDRLYNYVSSHNARLIEINFGLDGVGIQVLDDENNGLFAIKEIR